MRQLMHRWLSRVQNTFQYRRRTRQRSWGHTPELLEVRTLLSASVVINLPNTDTVSRNSGIQANGDSGFDPDSLQFDAPTISGNGRYAVFSSLASNLVAGDTNNVSDIFVRDLQTGAITRVSMSTGGVEGNNYSYHPSISADGRYVVFESHSSNLVANDTNRTPDIFLHDMQTGITSRISVGPQGQQGQSNSTSPVISANGRYVAFEGASLNWQNTDTGSSQIWVRDLQAGTTTLATMGVNGLPADSICFLGSITDNGRYIAFYSNASNLLSTPTNGNTNVFVRDMQAGATSLISIGQNGLQSNGASFAPSISGDGTVVAFVSTATNLISGDTNNVQDIYVRNLLTNTTERITVNTNGIQANGSSREPVVNQDGSLIFFRSYSTNLDLTLIDLNNVSDVFLYRTATKSINLVSKNSNGIPGNAQSLLPAIDASGHQLVYLSAATNLDLSMVDTGSFYDVFTVNIPNFPPVIAGFDTAVNYVENAQPNRLDTDATVKDSDSPNFGGGQMIVKLTARGQATDLLTVKPSDTGGSQITVDEFGVSCGGFHIASMTGGTGTTPLVLSFNDEATPARVQALLRAISFSSTSENPFSGARTVTITLTDSATGTPVTVSKTINVQPVNDKPVVDAFDADVTYTENGDPLVLDSNVTLKDVDSLNFDAGKLTVALTANKQSTDILSIKPVGSGGSAVTLSGDQVFVGGTLVGTFSGGSNNTALNVLLNSDATPSRVQALLRGVAFSSSSENPSTLARTVQVTVSDGDGAVSTAVTKTVNVVAVQDAPVIGKFDGSVEYAGSPVIVDSDATVTDVDSPNFGGGKLSLAVITNAQGTDVLSIRNQGVGAGQIGLNGSNVTFGGTVIGTWSGGTNKVALTILLNANATPTAAQALLRSIQFSNTTASPSQLPRTVRATLVDGPRGATTMVSKSVNFAAL